MSEPEVLDVDLDPYVPDPDLVLEAWAERFRLTTTQVIGKRRGRRHAAARAAVAHELYASGWYTKVEIGERLNRNHATICYLLKHYRPNGRRVSPGDE